MARYRPNAPPLRNGVAASCVVLPLGGWTRLLDFMADRFPAVSKNDWATRMEAGDVVDAEGQLQAADAPYRAGARVYYYRWVPAEDSVPFEEAVLWQDDHLLVADKPHFLPVIPSGRYVQETLLVRLRAKLGLEHLSPIHRIDRDTAGLVLFSVNPTTRNAYQALFRDRQVHKTYWAVADWAPHITWPVERRSRIVEAPHFMQQHEVVGEPNALTTIRPLRVDGSHALYELQPVTGQRHQLRVHMAALGLPIENDGIYPTLLPEGDFDYARPLQLLAQSIAFTDPVSDTQRQFSSQRSLRIVP